MKYRSRKYKTTSEQESYWPSFVDVMTTVSLVFLFLMVVSSGINKMFVDNIVEKRLELYKSIQSKLDKNNVDENLIVFDEKEGKIDIKTETFFDVDKYKLKSDGKDAAKILNKIFYEILSDSNIAKNIQYIEVVGHTDYIGNTIDNRILSTERAMSFLNSMVPMNSKLENDYGHKFKASGMSEFELNKTKKERDRSEYDDSIASQQRKIEIRMVFSNEDIEDAIKSRNIKKY